MTTVNNTDYLLHKLRNCYNRDEDERRADRLEAADLIQKLGNTSELSKVAKALNFEGIYGQSLDKRVVSVISERNGLREQVDTLKREIRLLQEIIADAESWSFKGLPDRNEPRWLGDARRYLGTD